MPAGYWPSPARKRTLGAMSACPSRLVRLRRAWSRSCPRCRSRSSTSEASSTATVKAWGEDAPGPLGADVPRRLRGGPAQPGRPDPLRGPQRARGRPRGAHLRRLARHGGGDARARHPAVHRRRPPAGARLRRVRALVLDRARLHEHAQRPRPRRHPAARGATAPRRTRSCSRGGHAAFNPEPVADFVDAVVLGDGEEIVLAITEVVREWKAEGRPGGRDGVLLRLAAAAASTSRSSTTWRTPTDGAIASRRAQPARRTRTACASTP